MATDLLNRVQVACIMFICFVLLAITNYTIFSFAIGVVFSIILFELLNMLYKSVIVKWLGTGLFFLIYLIVNYDFYYFINLIEIKYFYALFLIVFIINFSLLKFKINKFNNFFAILYVVSAGLFLSDFIYYINYFVGFNSVVLFIVLLFLVVSITDIFAYFVGKKFGKNKLCPNISPNKTVEGFVGGTCFAMLFSGMFYYFSIDTDLMSLYQNILIDIFIDYNINFLYLFLIGVFVLSMVSQLGDMYESSLKRIANIKDSGKSLGAHGGFFDRFDGFVSVIVALGLIVNFLI